MTVSYLRFYLAGLAMLVCSTALRAQQPGVDCARPVNWTEQMLCADAGLMELHVRLQRAHDERRRLLDGDAYLDLVSYHHGWLRGREECRTASDLAAQKSCLSDIYLTRIAQLERKGGMPATAQPTPPPPPPQEPALLACRGAGPGWLMEVGASFARLRVDAQGAVQSLQGRVTQSSTARTLAWRGRAPNDGADTVAMVMDQTCAIEGEGARFAMTARVLLPDGGILSGCCQRTPVAAPPPPAPSVAIPNLDIQGGEGGLYAPGTTVRLRDVDGATVALRKSARISSGNILARVRAGSMASVEQTAIREGTSWYYLAVRGSDLKGWVMADLVEPVVAMATREPVPRISPEVADDVPAPASRAPVPEPQARSRTEDLEDTDEGQGYQGTMSPVSRPWWRLVAPHLPVIDACIAKARLRTARIVSVEADGPLTRHVYARDGLNTRIACTIRKGQQVKARTLGHKDNFPQIGALFTRAPAQPPSATCYRNNRVVDPRSRALLGWMSYLKPGRRCR